jgi:hypothetical protein
MIQCKWHAEKYVMCELHIKLGKLYQPLLLVALRRAQNRQVKTVCRCLPPPPPGTLYTTGSHSGSPPNWNTYRRSGSARTTMWICTRAEAVAAEDAEDVEHGFPTSTH